MEANEFVTKLKASGNDLDWCDLIKASSVYKTIITKVSAKDRGPFALNVLCVLCRNLDKVPQWKDKIDNKALLLLSIDCVRETRTLGDAERVKTLACVYHIHRYIVRQSTQIPPELVLKISYMPFECDVPDLLKEYCKTYWNILVDRLTYIEKLKVGRVAIIKLLPKLTEDIEKVIQIYDTVIFCSTVLTFILKKLHFLYNENNAKDLNDTINKIFERFLRKNDLKSFRKLQEKETMEVYLKFNDVFYVIADNSSKFHFKDTALNVAVRMCVTVLGHRPDIFHCLQTFYLNSILCVLTNKCSSEFAETIFNSLIQSCDTTEKMGYSATMYATYPYLSQFMKLYIEYLTTNTDKIWKSMCSENMQEICMKFVLKLMEKLERTEQIVKCENCATKIGLHDAIRLSFLTKIFVTNSLNFKMDIDIIFPAYLTVVQSQHSLLNKLCVLGCVNYEKCFRKLQTDVHNTAITLNKAQYYRHSIKLFDIYLEEEIKHFKMDQELKNISRALYNKSICELDCKLFEDSLLDAYLSLIFSAPDGLNSDKYMSLVMDIKSKEIKNREGEEEKEGDEREFQLISVLDACEMAIEKKRYGNLKPFLCHLKFSELLRHEYDMYAALWPSLAPVAGVWRALRTLVDRKPAWIEVEELNAVQCWYGVVSSTPGAVRSLDHPVFRDEVKQLLAQFDDDQTKKPDLKLFHITLMFLQCEFDLRAASDKYGWKCTEQQQNEQSLPTRTLQQEHDAFAFARRAAEALARTQVAGSSPYLLPALKAASAFVPELLHTRRDARALQLAWTCVRLSHAAGDREYFLRNLGTVLSYTRVSASSVTQRLNQAIGYCADMLKERATVGTAIEFLAQLVVYYVQTGSRGAGARVLRLAQATLLDAGDKYDDINLDIATGLVMEAQLCLSGSGSGSGSGAGAGGAGPGAAAAPQRHYLSARNTATTWFSRRVTLHAISLGAARGGRAALRTALRLRQARRAAVRPVTAADVSGLVVCGPELYQHSIEYILGMQSESQHRPIEHAKKDLPYPSKQQLETMLECEVYNRTPSSPTLPELPPQEWTPEFLNHPKNCLCAACDVFPVAIMAAVASTNPYQSLKNMEKVRNKLPIQSDVEDFIKKSLNKMYEIEINNELIKIFIDIAVLELSRGDFRTADETVLKIQDMVDHCEEIDVYLKNELLNVIIASAKLRDRKQIKDTGLEEDFDTLKLSPQRPIEIIRTPESKATQPPIFTAKVLKEEEVPAPKRKVIKLKLDKADDDKKTVKKTVFKIPVPITNKPELETATPRPSRKPKIVVTLPSDPETPREAFFTPTATPEQFFTPMSTIKTYNKKPLRQNIVKNLEKEFLTPDKENEKALKKKEGARVLKRVTSPGKLKSEKPSTSRSMRTRKL